MAILCVTCFKTKKALISSMFYVVLTCVTMRVKIWYKYTKWVYGAILATDIEFNSPHFIELFCFSNKKTSLTSEDHII